MKKAGRFGKYGEQKRRERFKLKHLKNLSWDKEKGKAEERRRKNK